jgi:hypothetical protein
MATRRHSSVPVIAASVFLAVAGCGTRTSLERSMRRTVPDTQVHVAAHEHFVSTKAGNLLQSTVFSAAERAAEVGDFINAHRVDFGIGPMDTLQFAAPEPESEFEFGDRLLTAVTLLQSVNGMRIVDREQLGLFDLESGELKAIKVAVTDPVALQNIRPPRRTDNIQSLAARFLESRGITNTGLTVSDSPAYSVVLGMAGFEARCTSKPNSPLFTRIRLIVNTDTGVVAFLSKEEIHVPQG